MMTQKLSDSMISLRGLQVLLAAVFALWSCTAHAVTLNFDQYIGGADLGGSALVSLNANAVADGIEITLTNTSAYDAFIGRLAISYAGQRSDIHLAASANTSTFWPSSGGKSPININSGSLGPFGAISVEFWGRNSPVAKIRSGERLGFVLLGANMNDLLSGRHGAIINMITKDGGLSLYATASLAAVPLPAAGLMLLGALGLLGVARRRRA